MPSLHSFLRSNPTTGHETYTPPFTFAVSLFHIKMCSVSLNDWNESSNSNKQWIFYLLTIAMVSHDKGTPLMIFFLKVTEHILCSESTYSEMSEPTPVPPIWNQKLTSDFGDSKMYFFYLNLSLMNLLSKQNSPMAALLSSNTQRVGEISEVYHLSSLAISFQNLYFFLDVFWF